eukprot:COSAG01_NODE_11567_length_1902_cov_1.484748_1_plen_150_part_00
MLACLIGEESYGRQDQMGALCTEAHTCTHTSLIRVITLVELCGKQFYLGGYHLLFLYKRVLYKRVPAAHEHKPLGLLVPLNLIVTQAQYFDSDINPPLLQPPLHRAAATGTTFLGFGQMQLRPRLRRATTNPSKPSRFLKGYQLSRDTA